MADSEEVYVWTDPGQLWALGLITRLYTYMNGLQTPGSVSGFAITSIVVEGYIAFETTWTDANTDPPTTFLRWDVCHGVEFGSTIAPMQLFSFAGVFDPEPVVSVFGGLSNITWAAVKAAWAGAIDLIRKAWVAAFVGLTPDAGPIVEGTTIPQIFRTATIAYTVTTASGFFAWQEAFQAFDLDATTYGGKPLIALDNLQKTGFWPPSAGRIAAVTGVSSRKLEQAIQQIADRDVDVSMNNGAVAWSLRGSVRTEGGGG